MTSRRDFLAGAASLATATLPLASRGPARPIDGSLHVATNVYPWITFARREGRTFGADLDAELDAVARAGLDGFEAIGESPEQVTTLGQRLRAHGLEMRSLYVNSTLHEADKAPESVALVLAIVEAATPFGCRILVTNPSPIRWGGAEDKSDAQLMIQAEQLDRLGAELARRGVTLAYHNHDSELRQAAREFHHMLAGTDPDHVKFCLDAHWVYRGSGDSQVALFDVVRLYGSRIIELHLRQSRDGIWTEAFGTGDIDYPRLAAELKARGLRPHIVLEQAVEESSPRTIDAVEAHRQGQAYAREVFAAFGDA